MYHEQTSQEDVQAKTTLKETCVQAFRCRSSQTGPKQQGLGINSKGAEKEKSGRAHESADPSNLRPNKRPRHVHETTKAAIASSCRPVAMAALTQAEEATCDEQTGNMQIVKNVSLKLTSDPAAVTAGLASSGAFVLSAASLRARGKQKIPLEDAKGLPERLGDMPLRLIVGGNNPSDHAW